MKQIIRNIIDHLGYEIQKKTTVGNSCYDIFPKQGLSEKRFYNIGADVVTPWTTPFGGAVFLPRWEDIQPIVAEAMAPAPEARLIRTYMPVEVLTGR